MRVQSITLLCLLSVLVATTACDRGNARQHTPIPVERSSYNQLETSLEGVLAAMLRERGVDPLKAASDPPTGESNRVNDLSLAQNEFEQWVLTWHYRNQGDYDQNGLVAIPDVTRLAMHFGETYEPTDVNCLLAVIDGSGNHEIDIADVSPLAQNFGAEFTSYKLEIADSAEGPYNEWTRISLAEMTDDGGRLRCEVPLLGLEANYFRVTPVDAAGNEGVISQPYTPDLAAPEITAVRPPSCLVDVATTFQADVTGSGLRTYEWQFGEGVLPQSSSDEAPTAIMTLAGNIECSLTVTTPFGEDSYDFTVVVVEPGAGPYISSVQPQSGLSGVVTSFAADAGGDEPLTFAWDFGGGAEPNESNERMPTVTLSEPGEYQVSLTVANELWGSATYKFTLHVVQGMEIEVQALRLRVEGVENTLEGDLYIGTELFRTPLTGQDCEGQAQSGGLVHGYLDAVRYYYAPEDRIFGFDDDPPAGQEEGLRATLGYLRSQLRWEISGAGYSPEELFEHNIFAVQGELLGSFKISGTTCLVQALLPAGTLGSLEDLIVQISVDVIDAG